MAGKRPPTPRGAHLLGIATNSRVKFLPAGCPIHVMLASQALRYHTVRHRLSLTFHRMVARVREGGG
jgi:hypothetical protein